MQENDVSIEEFTAYITRVRSKATASKYAQGAQVFLETCRTMGYPSLTTLPANILSVFSARMSAQTYNPATIKLYVAGAKRYLVWARDQGAKVPELRTPDLPRIKHRIKEILTSEQLQRYWQLSSEMLHEPFRTMTMLSPCVGLRASELVSLKLKSLSRRAVPLRDGSVKHTYVLQLIGKGGDERLVPVLDEGVTILQHYIQGWRKYCSGPWLFPRNKLGRKPVSDRSLRNALEQVRIPLGTDELTPHTLRRTYVVTLWRSGVTESVIARIVGHKNLQTLFKHYLSLDEQDILRAFHNRRH